MSATVGPRPSGAWLIEPDEDAFINGFSAVLNEGAETLSHPLFHYTSEAGLNGLIGTGELWATDVDFFDDATEIKHGWNACIKVARSWTRHGSFFDKFVADLPAFIEEQTTSGVEPVRRFVVSFCSQRDYLLAWRAYADDSRGYCCEFGHEGLQTGDYWYVARVEYNPKAQEAEIKRILERMSGDCRSVLPAQNPDLLVERVIAATVMWLSLVAPTFKDIQYESEREWRLIKMVPTTGHDQSGVEIQHRLRGGELVPYVPRPIGKTANLNLELKRVVCGARLSSRAVESARQFVTARHPNCVVEQSKIAVRRRS